MALVTGFTKERMLEIENETIVDGEIRPDDHLYLISRDGQEIDAGIARGDQGPPGTNGTNGTNGATGATGPAGPTALVGLPLNLSTAASTMSASGNITGLTRNNLPMLANHTYGWNINFTLEVASLDPDSRWDIWLRQNGADWQRFAIVQPGFGGISMQNVRGQVFGGVLADISTNDYQVYAELVIPGSTITPSGSVTLKRDFWVVDYGIVT